MPIQQLIILGIVAMAGLAALRVVRFNRGLTPIPDGRARRLFQVGFLVIPPVVLGMLTQQAPPASQMLGIGAIPTYVAVIVALAFLMWIASQVVGQVSHGRTALLVRLALSGYEADPYAPQVDPPVTATLADSVVVVDRANAAFPRGPGFPSQVARMGFRDDWEELDVATRTLEGRIADDHRLGIPVASSATATANDARSRLATLRRLAFDEGQAWAAA